MGVSLQGTIEGLKMVVVSYAIFQFICRKVMLHDFNTVKGPPQMERDHKVNSCEDCASHELRMDLKQDEE